MGNLLNGVSGALGTLVRSGVGVFDGLRNGESFEFKRFGASVCHAVLLGFATGFIAPEPVSAATAGYVGGIALDKVGLNFVKSTPTK